MNGFIQGSILTCLPIPPPDCVMHSLFVDSRMFVTLPAEIKPPPDSASSNETDWALSVLAMSDALSLPGGAVESEEEPSSLAVVTALLQSYVVDDANYATFCANFSAEMGPIFRLLDEARQVNAASAGASSSGQPAIGAPADLKEDGSSGSSEDCDEDEDGAGSESTSVTWAYTAETGGGLASEPPRRGPTCSAALSPCDHHVGSSDASVSESGRHEESLTEDRGSSSLHYEGMDDAIGPSHGAPLVPEEERSGGSIAVLAVGLIPSGLRAARRVAPTDSSVVAHPSQASAGSLLTAHPLDDAFEAWEEQDEGDCSSEASASSSGTTFHSIVEDNNPYAEEEEPPAAAASSSSASGKAAPSVRPGYSAEAASPPRVLSISVSDYLLAHLATHWRSLRNLRRLELRNCPSGLAQRYPQLFHAMPGLTELKLAGADTRLKEVYGPSHPGFKVGGGLQGVGLLCCYCRPDRPGYYPVPSFLIAYPFHPLYSSAGREEVIFLVLPFPYPLYSAGGCVPRPRHASHGARIDHHLPALRHRLLHTRRPAAPLLPGVCSCPAAAPGRSLWLLAIRRHLSGSHPGGARPRGGSHSNCLQCSCSFGSSDGTPERPPRPVPTLPSLGPPLALPHAGHHFSVASASAAAAGAPLSSRPGGGGATEAAAAEAAPGSGHAGGGPCQARHAAAVPGEPRVCDAEAPRPAEPLAGAEPRGECGRGKVWRAG